MSVLEFTRMPGWQMAEQVTGNAATEDMLQALRHTRHVTNISIDGENAGIIGICPPTLLSDEAYIWLYHTEIFKEHKFLMVRYSQRVIEEVLKEFPTLVGHCHLTGDEMGERSIRWLRWLGAEFGPAQGKLMPFRIRKKVNG